jgi:hypothetical protein
VINNIITALEKTPNLPLEVTKAIVGARSAIFPSISLTNSMCVTPETAQTPKLPKRGAAFLPLFGTIKSLSPMKSLSPSSKRRGSKSSENEYIKHEVISNFFDKYHNTALAFNHCRLTNDFNLNINEKQKIQISRLQQVIYNAHDLMPINPILAIQNIDAILLELEHEINPSSLDSNEIKLYDLIIKMTVEIQSVKDIINQIQEEKQLTTRCKAQPILIPK